MPDPKQKKPHLAAQAKPRERYSSGRARVLINVTLAAFVIGAASFGLAGMFKGGDQVSDAEAKRIEQNFEGAYVSAEPINIAVKNEVQRAVNSLQLEDKSAAQLIADVEAQKVELVWLTFLDNKAQDGDVVTVSSGGVRTTIPLSNAGTVVAVPKASYVTVSGVADGGGGITVSVLSGGNPLPLPLMAAGQSITLPVR